jgi:hypothetical protein
MFSIPSTTLVRPMSGRPRDEELQEACQQGAERRCDAKTFGDPPIAALTGANLHIFSPFAVYLCSNICAARVLGSRDLIPAIAFFRHSRMVRPGTKPFFGAF